MPNFTWSNSLHSPSEAVHSTGMRSFTSRHPNVVDTAVVSPAGKPRAGFGRTHGARVIDSDPPATTMSASPAATARDAMIAASRLDPHSRFIVVAGIDVGRPARRIAMRPTLRLSSPAPFAQPQNTSPSKAGSKALILASKPDSADAARSSGRTPASAPPIRANGVRVAAKTNDDVMSGHPASSVRGCAGEPVVRPVDGGAKRRRSSEDGVGGHSTDRRRQLDAVPPSAERTYDARILRVASHDGLVGAGHGIDPRPAAAEPHVFHTMKAFREQAGDPLDRLEVHRAERDARGYCLPRDFLGVQSSDELVLPLGPEVDALGARARNVVHHEWCEGLLRRQLDRHCSMQLGNERDGGTKHFCDDSSPASGGVYNDVGLEDAVGCLQPPGRRLRCPDQASICVDLSAGGSHKA